MTDAIPRHRVRWSARRSTSDRTRSISSSRSWRGIVSRSSSTSRCSSGSATAILERGFLGGAARGELTATLVRYADSARRLGATDITFLGTEPIRRAADAAMLVQEVVAATGAPLHVVSHEEEAFLTLVGVTEGMPVTHQTLVVDVGGGSSEFVIVDADRAPRAAGLRVGSAMLTGRFVTHDPATPGEIEAMRAAAIARGARRS